MGRCAQDGFRGCGCCGWRLCGQLSARGCAAQVVNAYTGASAPSTAALRQFNFSPEERASISLLPLRDLLLCAGQPPAAGAALGLALAAEPGVPGGRLGAAPAEAAGPAAPAQHATEPAAQRVVVESTKTEQATSAHGTVVVVEEQTVCVAVCPAAGATALQSAAQAAGGAAQAAGGAAPADRGTGSVDCGEGAEAQRAAQAPATSPAGATGWVTASGGACLDRADGASLGPSAPAAGPAQQTETAQACASNRQQHAEPSGRSLPQPVNEVRSLACL